VRYLLDTHALIWALSEPSRLPTNVRTAIEDPRNDIHVSAASAWEIGIKAGLGKIDFPLESLEGAIGEAGFVELPVCVRHAVAIKELPSHHRDPFDRLLVAQAALDELVLVTRDRQLSAYNVRTLWGEETRPTG
jgi:PIN domain nuclease of toxin-antitoxin system